MVFASFAPPDARQVTVLSAAPKVVALALAMILVACGNAPFEMPRPLAGGGPSALEHAPASYDFEALSEAGRARAFNAAHRLNLDILTTGIRVEPARTGGWGMELRLENIGCGPTRSPIGATLDLKVEGNRASLIHSPQLTQWYQNGPAGVEHGFVVAVPPHGCAASLAGHQPTAPLDLQLQFAGDFAPVWSPFQQAVILRAAGGQTALVYSDLHAFDATGRPLAATMKLVGTSLWLQIEQYGAQYPITVDPLIGVPQQKLLPSVPYDPHYYGFGISVALDGDTAVVSARGDNDAGTNAGAVYVFGRSGNQWSEQCKLIATDGWIQAFGSSVAISVDTILIGAPQDDDNGYHSGSAYVYVRTGAGWTFQDKLLPSDGVSFDRFGTAVAIEGDTALVGADHAGIGAAYVFTRNGNSWTQQQKLAADDGEVDDFFGRSVALYADTAFIGAYGDDDNGEGSGSAYVFIRNSTAWDQQQKLTASDGASGDQFGIAVAIEAGTALIGADGKDTVYEFAFQGSWTEQAQITGADSSPGDMFGSAVDIDGDSMLVRAPQHDLYGASYVFVRSGGNWLEQQKLTEAQIPTGYDVYSAVALDGDTALVGETMYYYYTPGSASVYARSGSSWSEQTVLTASDRKNYLTAFGYSLALDADTLIVGAPGPVIGISGYYHTGLAYALVQNGTQWTEQAILEPNDLSYMKFVGIAVAVDGDTALVGAKNAKAVYYFQRTGTSWLQQQKLVGWGPSGGQYSFGEEIVVENDVAVVGAPGELSPSYAGTAYVFGRTNGSWSAKQQLVASEGLLNSKFGAALAFDGDTLAVGAPDFTDPGTVYLFGHSGGSWSEQHKLTANDGMPGDRFGTAVALEGDALFVGALGQDSNGTDAGAVYRFVRTGGSWLQQQKLLASDGASYDWFGTALALDGDRLVVGASKNDDLGPGSGAAYLFVRNAGIWSQHDKLSVTQGGGLFGHAVALGNDTVVIGAPGDDETGQNGGAAFSFQLKKDIGDPCAQPDECASGYCVDLVCCDQACGGGASDDCQACSVTAGAASDGVCGPTDGNPCDDGTYCNGTETCTHGVCANGSGDPCPGPDGDSDCAESCNEAQGDCTASDPPASPCGDDTNNSCTEPDTCNGHGDCLPNHVADGTGCDDGIFCNGTESCAGGVCANSSGPPCEGPDGDADCAESCDEATANCLAADQDGTPCAGGMCLAGLCEGLGGFGGVPNTGGQGGTPAGGSASGGAGGGASHLAQAGGGNGGAAPGGGQTDWDLYGRGCSCRQPTQTPQVGWLGVGMLAWGLAARRRSSRRRRVGAKRSQAILALAGLCACGSNGSSEQLFTLAAEGHGAAVVDAELPSALQAAPMASIQRRASAEYDFTRQDHPLSAGATNPAHGLRITMAGRGIRCEPTSSSTDTATPPWALELQLSGIGRGNAVDPISTTTALELSANGAVFHHGPDLQQWFVNGPLGVEQGFVVHTPYGQGGDDLHLQLEFQTELRVSLAPDARTAVLSSAQGRRVLHYAHLAAYDATGRQLPAHMVLSDKTLSLYIDERSARYPIVIDPLIGIAQPKLAASVKYTPDAEFGYAVAIDGDTALIGAPTDPDDVTAPGAAFVFVRNGGLWTEQAQLVANDGADEDLFGYAVALKGDIAMVGAYGDDDHGNGSGSAYVFVRSTGTWSQQQKLTASDADMYCNFGYAVDFDGASAIIGARNSPAGTGTAYVYLPTGSSWTEQAKLKPSVSSWSSWFGAAVAIDGNRAIVGAPYESTAKGSAHIFKRVGSSWQEQAKLTVAAGQNNDRFGISVALDSDTALVGADGDDYAGSWSGAVYVYKHNGYSWAEQAKLKASDAPVGANFGNSVALVGDQAVIGAREDPEIAQWAGAAYVFSRSAAVWTEQAKLTASDGKGQDRFGSSVAVDSGTLLAGAPHTDDKGFDSGAAYAFVQVGSNFVEQAKLTSDAGDSAQHLTASSLAVDGTDALVGSAGPGPAYWLQYNGTNWVEQGRLPVDNPYYAEFYGTPVALCGDTALVGTGYKKAPVFVFVRTGSSWTKQTELTGSASSHSTFGSAVAISGDTAFVGDRHGAVAHVFVRTGTSWTEQTQLSPNQPWLVRRLGASIALHGDTAIIGAPEDLSHSNPAVGAAFVYVRTNNTWVEQAILTASDGAVGHQFGEAVALYGDTALVGAQGDDDNGQGSGSVYVFLRIAGQWTEQAKLTVADGVAGDSLGCAVALEGDVALLGSAGNDELGASAGAAYLFARTGGVWTEQAKLLAPEGASGDQFGTALTLSADRALVGAPGDDDNGANSGSTYPFVIAAAKGDGEGCNQSTECLSGHCVDGVCCNSACGNGTPSDCVACSVATGAAVDGICGPSTGNSCDDGLYCNGIETCANGTCNSSGDPCVGPDGDSDCAESCNEATTDCSVPDPAGTACGDGSTQACTGSDTCDGQGNCGANHLPDGSVCDDGLFCNGVETCVSGVCTSGLFPCPGPDGDDDCAESCDETNASCQGQDPDGAPCASGVCLAGVCEGSGSGGGANSGGGAPGGGPSGGGSGGAMGGQGATVLEPSGEPSPPVRIVTACACRLTISPAAPKTALPWFAMVLLATLARVARAPSSRRRS